MDTDAITITTLVYLARIMTLFFAIMYTLTFARNLAIIAGREAASSNWSMNAKNIIVPTILWVIFYILVQAPTFPMG